MDCFFISTPLVLAAYILSKFGIGCLLFEHITMRSFPPINAPKLLGGGTVGLQYSGNHKAYPLRLVSLNTKLQPSRKPSAYWVNETASFIYFLPYVLS
jgi:hypothetical protein